MARTGFLLTEVSTVLALTGEEFLFVREEKSFSSRGKYPAVVSGMDVHKEKARQQRSPSSRRRSAPVAPAHEKTDFRFTSEIR
jgi:hypothetical protein